MYNIGLFRSLSDDVWNGQILTDIQGFFPLAWLTAPCSGCPGLPTTVMESIRFRLDGIEEEGGLTLLLQLGAVRAEADDSPHEE